MKIKYYCWVVLLFISYNSFAVVRTVFTNQKIMKTVNLKMGQSTVLRFLEKPKKAVIGNQNYYNIEFVEGTNDVTIQPLGNVVTNLFLYTEYRSYGLILKVKDYGSYDDLVNIRWSHSARNPKLNRVKKRKSKVIRLRSSIKNVLSFTVNKVFTLSMNGTHVIDISLKNLSQSALSNKDIKLSTTRSKKPFGKVHWVWSKDNFKSNEVVKVRGFLKTKNKKDFSLYVQVGEKKERVIISKEYLSTSK